MCYSYLGYTHHWKLIKTYKCMITKEVQEDIRKVLNKCKDILTGPEVVPTEDMLPEVTEKIITFNGRGEDAHEDFVFVPFSGPNNCKTAKKPYDMVVTACLIILKVFYEERIEVHTDGLAKDWEHGANLLKAIGYRFNLDITEEGFLVVEKDEEEEKERLEKIDKLIKKYEEQMLQMEPMKPMKERLENIDKKINELKRIKRKHEEEKNKRVCKKKAEE